MLFSCTPQCVANSLGTDSHLFSKMLLQKLLWAHGVAVTTEPWAWGSPSTALGMVWTRLSLSLSLQLGFPLDIVLLLSSELPDRAVMGWGIPWCVWVQPSSCASYLCFSRLTFICENWHFLADKLKMGSWMGCSSLHNSDTFSIQDLQTEMTVKEGNRTKI